MRKFFRILGVLLLLAAVAGTFVYLWKKSQPEKVVYEYVSPFVSDLSKTTLATGKIEPRDEVKIKPQMSGIIEEIYKQAGDKVSKNELIAKLRVIPDMTNLSNAESQVRKARISLDKAKLDFDRQSELFRKNLISAVAYEDAEVVFSKAKEDYALAQENYSIVKDGITKSSSASTTFVRSTVDGTILDIPEKVGNSVVLTNNFNEGTTIATVADMADLLFVGKIDETEVGKLSEQMPIKIIIGALDAVEFDGILEYIAPKGTTENGAVMFEIKAAVTIPDNVSLRAGYSANARITLDHRDSVMVVPEGALRFDADSSYVEVLMSENPETFENRRVRIGLSDGVNAEIVDGNISLNDKLKK